MNRRRYLPCVSVCAIAVFAPRVCSGQVAVPLPEGVTAVWDPGKAYHETTATRERICLNGLWRWQPADAGSEAVPAGNWGYFKVPGIWPGITDYMQKDSQTVFGHPSWRDIKLGSISAAWYERTMTTNPSRRPAHQGIRQPAVPPA